MIETSKKFEAEIVPIKEQLNKLAESRNLLEPFERLRIACEQVHQQKSIE
jgi:ribosomal protein L31E